MGFFVKCLFGKKTTRRTTNIEEYQKLTKFTKTHKTHKKTVLALKTSTLNKNRHQEEG